MPAPTKIIACNCVSSFQDTRYGHNNRLANVTGGTTPGYRCTVCDRTAAGAPVKVKAAPEEVKGKGKGKK